MHIVMKENILILRYLLQSGKRYAKLAVTCIRLSFAEKMTVVLAVISLAAVILLIGGFALLFLTMGCVEMLCQSMDRYWSYIIVGGLYAIMLSIVIVFRRSLITNPISRFISRLIIDMPKNQSEL